MLKILLFRKSFRILPVIIGILFFFIAANAVVRDGQIDNFTVNPISVGGLGRINSLVPQPDGKIIVGGGFVSVSAGTANNVARLNPDGSFDETFNIGSGANQAVYNVFLLADGKILISGDFSQYNSTARNRIARLNADGSLDTSYNPNLGTGYVKIVAVQPDGKAVITGTFTSIGGVTRNRIARLNVDGSLDLTFDGGAGPSNSTIYKGLVQPDGKILLAGSFSSYDGVVRSGIARINANGSLDTGFVPGVFVSSNEFFDMSLTLENKIYLAGDVPGASTFYRLNADGSLDTTFNTGGAHTGDNGRIYSVLAQPDGKVILGGEFDSFRMNDGQTFIIRYRMCRFNADGSFDYTFTGQAGSSTSYGGVRALAYQSSDKILVGGDFPILNDAYRGGIGRMNLNGSTDSSFMGFFGSFSTIDTFHLLPNGKIYVGGAFQAIGTSFKAYCARLNSDGVVDNSFAIDPRVNKPISVIKTQPDDKVVLGGYSGDTFGNNLGKGVWRVNGDGSLDQGFNAQIGALQIVRAIAIQADGKILIGGDFTTVNGESRTKIARLNADGSLDTTFNPNFSAQVIGEIVIQPDGKILVGGNFSSVNGSAISNIVRLNSNGTTDTTFNIGGGAGGGTVNSILLNDANKLLIGGSFSSFNGVSRNALVRLNLDGTFDNSLKPVRLFSGVNSVIQLPNKKILIGGSVSSGADASPRERIIRLFENGTIDFSFEVGRMFRNGSNGSPWQLGLQPDGKIIVSGFFDTVNGLTRRGIMRLNAPVRIPPPIFDYDGDGKTDVSLFRPSNGGWYRINSYFNQFRSFQFGLSEDKIVPADYDGDFRTDIAVFRPSQGAWYIQYSSDLSDVGLLFGLSEDKPAVGDYDGDGKADIAVYRPSNGVWYLLQSQNGFTALQFGLPTDVPVPADYDGDGKTDIAIYRPSSGEWWINKSTGGTIVYQFGSPGDKAVQADFTGDGKTDVAVWRPSTGQWFVLRSENLSYYAVPFGINGDVPAAADYDGDSKADIAVYRNGTWYILYSATGRVNIFNYGLSNDIPLVHSPS